MSLIVQELPSVGHPCLLLRVEAGTIPLAPTESSFVEVPGLVVDHHVDCFLGWVLR